MLRAEKSTPNANAARTMIAGVVAGIMILVGLDPAVRLYDEYLRPRPWISAEVVIADVEGGNPAILYTVNTKTLVSGRWKAWVQSAGGHRLCGGSGDGDYYPALGEGRYWSWDAWLGRDCVEPLGPYRLCVSYAVETPRGARGHFGPYCSEIHRRQK